MDKKHQQQKPSMMLLSARRSVSLSLPSPPSMPSHSDAERELDRRPVASKPYSRQSIAGPIVSIIVPQGPEYTHNEEEEEEDDSEGTDNDQFRPAGNESPYTLAAGQQLQASPSPKTTSPKHRRKASLMPPVTEDDLRNDFRMGHRDPESVAALFGDDFASRFCVQGFGNASGIAGPSVVGTMPFSMQQLRQGLNPDQALLPHEIRDNSVPSGIPIVKMRRRVVTQPATALENSSAAAAAAAAAGGAASGTDEAVVPLSPVAPKFPSLPCFLSAFMPSQSAQANAKAEQQHQGQQHYVGSVSPSAPPALLDIPGVVRPAPFPFPLHFERDHGSGSGGCQLSQRLMPFRMPEPGQFYPDMAVTNPDLVQFQLVLNDWFRRQCKLRTSAFLLNSAEMNMTLCQVCGTELADKEGPIQCGDAEFLDNLFDGCTAVASCSGESMTESQQEGKRTKTTTTNDYGTVYSSASSSVVAKLGELSEELVRPLQPVLARLCRPSTTNANGTFAAPISLVGIKANGGFTAILLAVHQSENSREEELQLMRPHLDMLANLLSIFHNIEEQRRLAHQMQLFLCMTQNVFSSLQDMNQLVRNITKEAKALVHAEICSLFLLDKEHSELVAEVFEKNGTSDEYLTEIRMPLNQGIVGQVASTGLMMNVRDVYSHPNFYPKVDERTGFITRNILCFPIKDSSGNLVGVAELCNKIGRDSFTRHDEQIAATFAVYCAISISHCLLYRKLQEAHRRSHITAELLVQSSTLSIAPEDILRLTVRDIPSPDSFHFEFNQFNFVPRSIGGTDIYVEASLSMFKSLGFIDRYRIRRRTLARFLLMVQKGYRDVPYHNWSHAFAVAHFCFLLLRMPSVKTALQELERFALLVACLCHDIDHRGTTNAFQLQSKTPLAQLYSSEGSVLERHHFAQTVSILGMDECNIFDQLNQQQYQQIMDCIREVILATDIAAHLRKVERIAEMAKVGFDSGSDEHRYLFTCLLMTASDLSDQSKDFRHSKAIAENIYKEFFSQGDLEKEMGNRPIEMMDRERACVPKIQIEFMDTVALPVFRLLAQLLPDLESTHQALLHNRRCWLKLDYILQEQGLPLTSGGLEYLRDQNLDEKVINRVTEDEERAEDNPSENNGQMDDNDTLSIPINVWRRQSNGAGGQQSMDEQHQRQWPSGAKKYSLGH